MSAGLLLLGSLLLGGNTSSDGRLAVIDRAADFALIDQNEKPRRLSDYRGKAVLVSFIFTTCNGTCPPTTHRLGRIFDEARRQPDLKNRIVFLTIALDPERDRPEIFRNYRRLYDIDDARWLHLTGDPKTVAKVHQDWHMWTKPLPNGQLDHPSRVYLVDPQGRIREIYNLSFLRVPWVMDDLREVVGKPTRK